VIKKLLNQGAMLAPYDFARSSLAVVECEEEMAPQRLNQYLEKEWKICRDNSLPLLHT
jgi:hypothetical protein